MQDDQRFAPANEAAELLPTKLVADTNQRVCKKCKTHLVTDQDFDFCDVCRGISKEAPKAKMLVVPDEDQLKLQSVYVAQPGAQTPTIAVVAVICAFLIPLLGLILGYAARTEIRESGGKKGGDGLATFAIALGWLVLIALFVYIILVGMSVNNLISNF